MNRQLRGNLPPNEKANGKNRFLSLLLLFMAFISVQVYAQDVKVSGTVIAEADKFPIIGANIVVKGTTIGTVTDIDGNFSLDVPQNSTIAISYIGCETQEIKITGAKTLNIVLKDNAIGLDDVVVIGYGSQRKSDLTGGIVAVGEEKLQMVTTNNLMDKLAGQIPGMNVTTSNAKPGEDQSLRVRGENSLSADNSPLIVMDGIPYSGSLGDIDPDIIENMSVLKDASSAAIYGSRGANGVILIQTKKGKKGAPTVSYKGQVGMQQAQHRIDMMKGAEYVKYTQDYNRMKYGYSGDQLDPLVLLNPSERANYQNGSELDWQDIMFRNALTTSHQISISGGTEATTYMASISHLREDGVMENTGLKRTNIALNITQVLNKWLTVGMGTQAIQKEFGGEQPYLEAGLKMSPYGIYKDENDRYVDYPMDQTLFYNPMANIDATNDKTNRNVFISTFAEIQFPIDGLSFRTNFGYNYRNNFVGSYYGRNTLSGKKVNGSASIENIHYYDYTWENLLKYNKTFGLHKIDATALFSMQETTKKEAKESGESFVNDDSEYHNMAGAEKNKEITSKLTETAMLSYMLRLNYSYANKYLLTLTGRSDGYSAFGKNNKYAFFPSAGLAWNVSQEDFLKDSNLISNLKLHTSYGLTGNSEIDPYKSLGKIKSETLLLNGTRAPYSYMETMPNPDMKWEKTGQFDVGFNLGLFHNRLNFDVSYYNKKTTDLLLDCPVPHSTGFSTIFKNIGSVRNQGLDIMVNGTPVQGEFTWNSTVNLNFNKNEILHLGDTDADVYLYDWVGGGSILRVGESMGSFYGLVRNGIFTEEDYKAGKCEKNQIGRPDRSESREIIGKGLPDWTGSWVNNFSYKNFDLTVDFQFVWGVETLQRFMHSTYDRFGMTNGLSNILYDGYNGTNAGTMEQAIFLAYDKPHGGGDTTTDSQWVANGSYLRLNMLQLGYTFDSSVAKKVGLSGLRLYLSGNNLFQIVSKDFLGYDPESTSEVSSSSGVSSGSQFGQNMTFFSYPRARTFTFGVNVTF